jgi:hypothetical protein
MELVSNPLYKPCLIANRDDGARLDVVADGFLEGNTESVVFDVMVFNPLAPSHKNSPQDNAFLSAKLENKAKFESGNSKYHRSTCSIASLLVTLQLWVGAKRNEINALFSGT